MAAGAGSRQARAGGAVRAAEARSASRRTRTISGTEATLFVEESGDRGAPTVVLLHGYPDTHAVWDEVVELLRKRLRTVTYDIRGMGSSGRVDAPRAFALSELVGDLAAVLDAVSPDVPAHLVGHDWGAFQVWAALAEPALSGRIASFTAIAGPRLDASGSWLLRRLRPTPAGIGAIAGQALRSWYIGAMMIPRLPEAAVGAAIERTWPEMLRRTEGIEPRSGHPAATLARDARIGMALYRTNMRGQTRPRRVRPVPVPVQVVVPTRDRYISPALYEDAAGWAEEIWLRRVRAGHWVPRSHPQEVARHVEQLVRYVEGGAEAPALARARREAGDDRRPLRGRLAVITGAGSGIGRATALALAGQGAEVIAADIDLEAARETADLSEDPGSRIHPDEIDVADAAAMERFAEALCARRGVPDVVVNNAGIGLGGPFLDTSLADWEHVIDVNLWGVIHGSRLFAARMAEAGVEGHIFNIASAAAFMPSRLLPAYTTTKAAVLMLSECMRAELADYGIAVTAICPGVINTNIARNARIVGVSDEEERRLQRLGANGMRLRSFGPEKVAGAILEALRTNPAVVPVSPEARLMLTMSQLTPGALRRLARLNLRP